MPFPDLTVPFIPQEPTVRGEPDDLEAFARWAAALRLELDRFLVGVQRHAATKALVGTRVEVTVTDGFSLGVEDFVVCLSAASAVSSSDSVALQDGADGQSVILLNAGSEDITVKHGANTRLAGSADAVLSQYGTLHLVWDGSDWLQVGAGNDPLPQYVLGVGTHRITVSQTEPSNPESGDIWVQLP